jgi:uncharacterized protein YyaL (SSP411 family)
MTTLTRMAEGGIYTSRTVAFQYSVDPYWMIPHFQKCYDNGQLLAVAAQAALATADPLFQRVTDETADWLRRDMENPGGGFYATLDADSEGHEGRFYAWDREELRSLLPPDEYAAFAARFGIDRAPNFEGKWHVHCFKSSAQVAAEVGVDEDAAARLIDQARARFARAQPARLATGREDTTSWNGLAIARRHSVAEPPPPGARQSSARAAGFLHEHCWYQGSCSRFTRTAGRGSRRIDDHASLAWGLLELVQARWHAPHFAWAIEITEAMLRHFEDRDAGGFFFTADDHEQLILRPKTFGDDATPAGNGVAARLLVRLGFLLAEPRYLSAAERTLRAAWPVLEKYPHGHTTLAMALDELTAPPAAIVLRGEAADLAVWQYELDRLYDPRRLVLGIPADATDLPPALAEKKAPNRHSQAERSGAAKMAPGQLLAYVCRDAVRRAGGLRGSTVGHK